MSPDIAPESIKPDFQCSGPSPSDLKDPRCNSKPNVRGDYLDAGNPFRNLASLVCSETRSIGRVTVIQRAELVAGAIG
jgi:hypothetical protein